ncbi:MAG TPA: sporulation-delaying protein SdpB family protein [Nannocystaceae bacterium]|nr:sporulation-delaying protein SdpB family protein [Nannocystaceae bacterium]
MLNDAVCRFHRWIVAVNPWTNVYGVARSLIAGASALTLATNDSSALFMRASGMAAAPRCEDLGAAGLYCLIPSLDLVRWVAIAVLLVTASGWRPRWTAIPHWYVTWSYFASATILDGGDQIASILTLLMVPIALGDRRRWHWQAPATAPAHGPLATSAALAGILLVRVQVALVYAEAAVGKLRVDEWRNGTATYYYLLDPVFGVADWLRPAMEAVLFSAAGVIALTWGTIALEAALFAGLIAARPYRAVLLPLGIAFHLGIALFQGLPSFSLTMVAALILYLRPVARPFAVPVAVAARLRGALASFRRDRDPRFVTVTAREEVGT